MDKVERRWIIKNKDNKYFKNIQYEYMPMKVNFTESIFDCKFCKSKDEAEHIIFNNAFELKDCKPCQIYINLYDPDKLAKAEKIAIIPKFRKDKEYYALVYTIEKDICPHCNGSYTYIVNDDKYEGEMKCCYCSQGKVNKKVWEIISIKLLWANYDDEGNLVEYQNEWEINGKDKSFIGKVQGGAIGQYYPYEDSTYYYITLVDKDLIFDNIDKVHIKFKEFLND